MAIQIAVHFRFTEDWYRAAPVLGLVLAYYAVLRSVLRAQPELRRCRTRCRHCGIFFLTHPRNAGRRDLGCPFGCRAAHRCRRDNQRTAAYDREEGAKDKKRALNAQRRKTRAREATPPPPGSSPPSPPPPSDGLPAAWPRTMLPHLQMVSGLIERRPVSLTEVVRQVGGYRLADPASAPAPAPAPPDVPDLTDRPPRPTRANFSPNPVPNPRA